MAKISVDIENIKMQLSNIGYDICDCVEKENNGTYWQIKFSNSGAVVNIYDTNNKKNTVVNGKPEIDEKEKLKDIVDNIKCHEFVIDEINSQIIDLVRTRREDSNWDFKREWHKNKEDLLHDILCLSNNTENKEAYLIIGVTDDGDVIGVTEGMSSNDLYDFLKSQRFAGDHIPEVEIRKVYYKYLTLDVLICKISKFVPFFLVERYQGICDYQIYTRVGDTNTPKNRNANYVDTEKLWRIHFERENESGINCNL